MKVAFTDYGNYDLALERELLNADSVELLAAQPQCQDAGAVEEIGRDAMAIVAQYAPVTRAVIEALPKLRIISVPQIGVDTIDLEAAREQGVWVANAPTANITEVACHTLAMVLSLLRGLPAFDRSVRSGIWDYEAAGPLRRPGSLTYGLMGLGRIGRLVVERATPIFAEIMACDPHLPESAWPAGVRRAADPAALFSACDVVSLHLPMTEENRNFVDAGLLSVMKPGSFLVNVARGGVLESAAVLEALESGRLTGAALDVLPQEPPSPDDPLLRHPGVLLSPHAAFYSLEADDELRRTSVQNILDLLRHGRPGNVVVEGTR